MKKITKLAVSAFYNDKIFSQSNTDVKVEEGETKLYLFGNLIAIKKNQEIQISDGGYPMSRTTKERLNGLKGVSLRTSKGKDYLNDLEWDGRWISIN